MAASASTVHGVLTPTNSQSPCSQPPSPPNPSSDRSLIPPMKSPNRNAPSPPVNGGWSISDVPPETAMKMLCRSVQTLANYTGEIPPTPPLSRPATPRGSPQPSNHRATIGAAYHRRTRSRPATPVPADDLVSSAFTRTSAELGSPVACESEPATAEIGANTEPLHKQHEAIARKFYSRKVPAVSLEEYVMRLQRYCPMSTGVYLAAGAYIYKLGVEEKLVPVTHRTAHRLVLAALRVAMKALEDLRYPQARFAGVGGVGENELKTLEISLCYLTGFDLQLDCAGLYEKNMSLKQAAEQAALMTKKLPSTFQPKIPGRTRMNA